MANMTEKELLELKEKINKAKSRVSELKGELTYLKKQLKDTIKTDDIKEGEKILANMDAEIQDLDDEIKQRVEDLKEQYNV